MVRGVRPFLSNKYDLMKHPQIRLTADFDDNLTFDVEKYIRRKRRGAKNLIIKESQTAEVFDLTGESDTTQPL